MSFGSQLGFPISQSRTLRHRQVTTVTWDINTHHLATEHVSFIPGLGCSPHLEALGRCREDTAGSTQVSRGPVGWREGHCRGQNRAPIPDQDSRRLPGEGGQGGWTELARQRWREGVPASCV